MRLKSAHNKSSVLIPKRGREKKVPKYGEPLIAFNSLYVTHMPGIRFSFGTEAEILVEPDSDGSVFGYEVKKNPIIVYNREFLFIEVNKVTLYSS
jgi:hypothetical protein